MTVLLTTVLAVNAALGLAAQYGTKEVITHTGLNEEHCQNSRDCAYDEVCEKLCFWQQYTKDWVGCKVACVQKDSPHKPSGGGGPPVVFPFPAPIPEGDEDGSGVGNNQVQVEHQPPAYPPRYPPQPTKPPTVLHTQACRYDVECGYNQRCGAYTQTCECNHGFVADPQFADRCITTSPHYAPPSYPPKPSHPLPKYPPPPPEPQNVCRSAHDCRYGEKCCYWRKCSARGDCIVKYMCAKTC